MEGQPISLIEAIAKGNIIITTEFSGISDLISKENDYFIQPKSAKSIFGTLVKIKENLEVIINQYSLTYIQYVKSNFTKFKFANKILNVIKHVK